MLRRLVEGARGRPRRTVRMKSMTRRKINSAWLRKRTRRKKTKLEQLGKRCSTRLKRRSKLLTKKVARKVQTAEMKNSCCPKINSK